MGVIGKLLGGIFAFLGGIFKTVGGIFGLGKSGYYMEAEPLAAGAAEPAKLEAAKAEPAKAAVAKVETKAATAVQEAPAKADLAPASLETVKAAIAEPAANGTANGTANGKKTRKAKAETEKPAAPVKAAEPAKTDQTFAPNYLIQTSGSRRRPGPSMDYFRNIAKQVKT